MHELADSLPRIASGRIRHVLVRVVVCSRKHALDRALAAGAAPWRSRALMLRAAQLTRFDARRKLALDVADLVARTAPREFPSVHADLRLRAIVQQREAVLHAIVRLVEREPVDVATIAQLRLLLHDGTGRLLAEADTRAGSPP